MVSHLASQAQRPSAYEGAVEAALADLARLDQDISQMRAQIDAHAVRRTELVQLIRRLLDMLPSERRASYLRKLGPFAAEQESRGGPIFDNVVTLLRRAPRRQWSVSEMQQELAQAGVAADMKSVANVLGYLARAGKLTRVARGQYVSPAGWGIVSSEEIPGAEFGQTRLTEHD